MTDKELLTLAARAAGVFSLDVPIQDPYPHLWRPLTDPGDALRLAVALHIDFKAYELSVHTWVGDPIAQMVIASIEEPCGTDPLAATMRAIVRAAAEIGRRMPE